jgi:predicted glycogen debranching enzyme
VIIDDVGRLDFGREVCGELELAASREWLCTNGAGGFAAGTVAGLLSRRYHGLLVAALRPPVGRTLLVAKLEEVLEAGGERHALGVNRWADGTVNPRGFLALERFHLDHAAPVWTYAAGAVRVEKRVWMEHGRNTTYVRYRLLAGPDPVALEVKALVNYRDYHATTRGEGWWMVVEPLPAGVRVQAFAGARPFTMMAEGAEAHAVHSWYYRFGLDRERERGLAWVDDHLHAATFRVALGVGRDTTFTLSSEEGPAADGDRAWARFAERARCLVAGWREAQPAARRAPAWVEQLVLAADQFVVGRPAPDDPEGMSIIAGYPWFADWGRDTMISLPGLLLTTGRASAAGRILATFARFVDRGMLPNRFPDAGDTPEYNTVDATLWYFEAIRAYHVATGDDAALARLFPVLRDIVEWHCRGTRYGIGEDPADGLLRAGEPGSQLTWMDARVGDHVITPRTGKAVEVNALWYNALQAMAGFALRLGQPAEPWRARAARVAGSFGRFWNEPAGCCYDVIDGPDGHDAAIRPNQILAVSLPESPLPPARQRRVVDMCAGSLLASFGLRSLSAADRDYRGRCEGGPAERDRAYHQGTIWGWLLGPLALAHYRVHGDAGAARRLLLPMAHHLADGAVGTIGEIFDGDSPFRPRGCPAQAWSVAETLRAWHELAAKD